MILSDNYIHYTLPFKRVNFAAKIQPLIEINDYLEEKGKVVRYAERQSCFQSIGQFCR